MKIVTITFLTLSIAALSIAAQPQRSGGRAAQPTTERNKPSGNHLSETQQQNINKLAADFNAIKKGSQVTAEQKQALKNDMLTMADGATKPDQVLVQKLANDFSAALADGNINNKEKAQLSNDLYKVMNSANIPMDEVNQAIADAKVILEASGITKGVAQRIVNDLKAIATEAQNNAPTGGAKAQSLKGKLKRNE